MAEAQVDQPAAHSPAFSTSLSLLLLSSATLAFEINLTRLFSVSQFYHFAFMIVSLALLGFGASGTALTLLPGLTRKDPQRTLGWLAILTGYAILASYLLTNHIPFDSFSIAWDARQALILVMHYIGLASPFFFSGMAVGYLLARYTQAAGYTYAANLSGAALGCGLALAAPSLLGGEGMVTLSSSVAALAALASTVALGYTGKPDRSSPTRSLRLWRNPETLLFYGLTFLLLVFSVFDLSQRLSHRPGLKLMDLHVSPYKSVSYAMQYPGAQRVYQRWNAFSRVEVVRSPGIRSLPGLSYRYLDSLPLQDGLLVDGDDLSPILYPDQQLDFAAYLPQTLAFQLKPGAETLLLGPRGGLDVVTSLAGGAKQVTAVEVNPLVVEAAAHIYADPRVQVVIESERSFIRRTSAKFDVIMFSLGNSYHPVRSGAYSLTEDYRYTIEAFQDGLDHLKPGGVLVVTRWLQNPPSECLRAFALVMTALERTGADPGERLVALRGFNTMSILAKNDPFEAEELEEVRSFAAERAFDLVYASDILPEETNRYNVYPEPIYYQAFMGLLDSSPREAFYAAYPYEIHPPSDDRPFFGHFFKWSQARQVFAELGKTWQPFGGAGYFVIIALLGLAALLASTLILLPLTLARLSPLKAGNVRASLPAARHMAYFGLIGLAFFLVEIPLIQRFILYLGHPAYALTAVLFSLLLFSAAGSRTSHRLSLKPSLGLLVLVLASVPLILPGFFRYTLGLEFAVRLALTVLVLAPLGFLMGIPFPGGIRWAVGKQQRASQVPWIWAINGAASVVSAVLAALLALSFGFNAVFWIGALCYAAAWIFTWAIPRAAFRAHPRR